MSIIVNGVNNGIGQVQNLSTATNYTFITMFGGNDSVYGGKYADTILGGSGNDSLMGNGGNDLIKGEAGDDTIYSGIGNDTIYGGNGADVLSGDFGVDYLYSDAGNDIYLHYKNGGLDYINENNGGGNDIIWFPDIPYNDLVTTHSGSDLNITSAGVFEVVLKNQYFNTNYKIELIAGQETIVHPL